MRSLQHLSGRALVLQRGQTELIRAGRPLLLLTHQLQLLLQPVTLGRQLTALDLRQTHTTQ